LWARDPVQSVRLVGKVPTFRRNVLPPAEGSASESLVRTCLLMRRRCKFLVWISYLKVSRNFVFRNERESLTACACRASCDFSSYKLYCKGNGQKFLRRHL
jgi:hypothetical protein